MSHFQQITCTLENFEFEYEDVGNSIDGSANANANRGHYPSTNGENSVPTAYYKYPHKHIIATVDNTQHAQPRVCTADAAKPNVQNSVPAAVTVLRVVNMAKPIAQKPAPANSTPQATSTAQPTAPAAPMKAKQTAPAAAHAARPVYQNVATANINAAGNYLYHPRAIILNPASLPNAHTRPEAIARHAYYGQMTPQNYMVRPIYVRLVKPFHGNYLLNQMALNRPQISHVTLE